MTSDKKKLGWVNSAKQLKLCVKIWNHIKMSCLYSRGFLLVTKSHWKGTFNIPKWWENNAVINGQNLLAWIFGTKVYFFSYFQHNIASVAGISPPVQCNLKLLFVWVFLFKVQLKNGENRAHPEYNQALDGLWIGLKAIGFCSEQSSDVK